ncbi:formate dehydrogenase accessory protein FdhD [Lachnospiraceae bacterium TWA4]|nr:formate dehydrogenase accessory protein FdhD [Lachnospiraceae bacterium TWA4]
MNRDFGTAVILAGGNRKTSREHRREMCTYIVGQLQQIFSDVLIISDTPWVYENMSVRIEEDLKPNHGPMGGIYTAMKYSITKYVYVLACDMPIINEEYISYMLGVLSMEEADACVTLNQGWVEPFNAFYSTDLFYSLEDSMAKGENSMYNFLGKQRAIIVPEETARFYDQDLAMFKDLETFEEYGQFKRGKLSDTKGKKLWL